MHTEYATHMHTEYGMMSKTADKVLELLKRVFFPNVVVSLPAGWGLLLKTQNRVEL